MPGRIRLIVMFGVLLVSGAPSLGAQQDLPLAPVPPGGLHVSPWFEGWYRNDDGSFTLSFGFYNRNSEEIMEIPVGPDNRIEPAELNGPQPTSFTPGRERGVFALTVPADFADRDVVWTLTNRGGSHSVPGRVKSGAYELSHTPQAEGSVPPAVRHMEGGPPGRGPGGIMAGQTIQTRVGEPVTLRLYVDDLAAERPPVPLTTTWSKFAGPAAGSVTFEPRVQRGIADGVATTAVKFSVPGDYIVRGRVDNHAQRDSAPGEQCCWTNGYIRVTVAP